MDTLTSKLMRILEGIEVVSWKVYGVACDCPAHSLRFALLAVIQTKSNTVTRFDVLPEGVLNKRYRYEQRCLCVDMLWLAD